MGNEKNPIESFFKKIGEVKDGETVECMFHPGLGEKKDYEINFFNSIKQNFIPFSSLSSLEIIFLNWL